MVCLGYNCVSHRVGQMEVADIVCCAFASVNVVTLARLLFIESLCAFVSLWQNRGVCYVVVSLTGLWFVWMCNRVAR